MEQPSNFLLTCTIAATAALHAARQRQRRLEVHQQRPQLRSRLPRQPRHSYTHSDSDSLEPVVHTGSRPDNNTVRLE